jgi:NAD-dependent dihydropyrimidine dehydrogenase PreA subunit
MEMAVMWAAPMTPILMLVVWLLIDLRTALVCGTIALVMVFGLLAAVPYVPIVGAKRLVTFVALTILGAVVGSAAFFALGSPTVVELLGVAISAGVVTLVLSVDLTGSTPWFPSYINSFKNRFDVELVEDRCTGSAQCVLVCPKNVFEMDGRRRKVRIARPDDCLRCGACVVQCPEDALQFRFADRRIVPPSVVRTTRMNMLGRRSISIETGDDS